MVGWWQHATCKIMLATCTDAVSGPEISYCQIPLILQIEILS